MRYVKPAWFFKNRAKDATNLFSFANIESECNSYTYVCHCKKITTLFESSRDRYRCRCGNETFFNADEAKEDFYNFYSYCYFNRKVKISFEPLYKITTLSNKVQALCFIDIPIAINRNRLQYKEIVLASATPNKRREVTNVPKEYPQKIASKLKEMISEISEFEKYINLKLARKASRARTEQIYFFLNHINLKDIDFFHWSHAELLKKEHQTIQSALIEIANNKKFKSVKKAIFRNYQLQITNSKRFNPLLNYLATSKIDDPNFIVDIISMHHINNDAFLSKLDKSALLALSDFMIRHYTYKQVTHFFEHFNTFIKNDSKNFKHAYMVFEDILRQFNIIQSTIDRYYLRVRCTPKDIHDQFSKIVNTQKDKHLMDKKFTYTDQELSAQKQVDGYDARLPFSGAELYAWANALNNCLASYVKDIDYKMTTVYAFFKEEKIIFAVEIRNNEIMQAYRSYNRALLPDEQDVLMRWYKDFK